MSSKLISLSALTLCLLAASCVPVARGLRVGMTPDEAIQQMGSPDAKDTVPDPQMKGAELLRYTWTHSGQSATFGRDSRLIRIEQVKQSQASGGASQSPPAAQDFDPVSTPAEYVFPPSRLNMRQDAGRP